MSQKGGGKRRGWNWRRRGRRRRRSWGGGADVADGEVGGGSGELMQENYVAF